MRENKYLNLINSFVGKKNTFAVDSVYTVQM